MSQVQCFGIVDAAGAPVMVSERPAIYKNRTDAEKYALRSDLRIVPVTVQYPMVDHVRLPMVELPQVWRDGRR